LVSEEGQVDKLGCFVFADGDRYEGHFKWGMMHGYGVYYWANDRATYFGNWDNNSQSGCGVKFFNSGAVEYGEWKDDQYLGSFTGVCGREESWGAMNNALDVAQRARMFKYKPDSEVTLMRRGFTLHQDPVVYQEGTEWQMPGWRGETFEAPTAEELESQHPRLYAQMQRHNEIWERAWRYYNLDLKDALEEGVKRRSREEAEAEARALAASMAPEAQDDYDEYGDIDEKEEDKKGKKKKGKKGKKASRAASITLAWSAFDPKEAVAAAFEKVSKFARRRPPTSALANRARQRNASEREGTEARARAGPFASLSLAVPFGPFSK
jgi:hypothetical protein